MLMHAFNGHMLWVLGWSTLGLGQTLICLLPDKRHNPFVATAEAAQQVINTRLALQAVSESSRLMVH